MSPLISVALPAWNAAPFVDEAVASILGQSIVDLELLALDDGSTDETRAKLEAWAGRDRRVRALPNERNLGCTRTLNRALGLARGRWFARQDADDRSHPQRLEAQLRAAERVPSPLLVGCVIDEMDASGRSRPGSRGAAEDGRLLPWLLLFRNLLAGGHAFGPRERWQELGGFDPSLVYAEDYDWLVRLAHLGPIAVVPQALYTWRRGNPASLTTGLTSRYHPSSIEISRRWLTDRTGRSLVTDEVVALRDFWTRFPAPPRSWAEIDRLLQGCMENYRPPFAVPNLKKQQRIRVAEGWLALALRLGRGGDRREARACLSRARRWAGSDLPGAVPRWAVRWLRVRGRLDRLL